MNHNPPTETNQQSAGEYSIVGGAVESLLASSPEAPGAARRVVGDWLSKVPFRDAPFDDLDAALDETDAAFCETVVLATSEIVTNAVRHADQEEGSDLGLRCERRPRGVRISVHQAAESSYLPVVSFPPTNDVEGRGLAIVSKIVDRWGVSHEAGLTVWFELDRPTR